MDNYMDFSDKIEDTIPLEASEMPAEKVYVNATNILRETSFTPQIQYLGYNQKISYISKNVRHNNTVNVKIVLSSKSPKFLRAIDGKREELRPPFVAFTGPGFAYDSLCPEEWEEIYISYDKSEIPFFKEIGIDHGSRALELSDSSSIISLVREIVQTAKNVYEKGNIDRIDRLCELILFEVSILKSMDKKQELSNERAVREVAAYLRKHYREKIKWDEIIASCGMSKRTFHRYWSTIFSINPAKYVTKLKMDTACRLLKDTPLRIGEIAVKLKYDDPLYFSRTFKKITGMSPRKFRTDYSE